MRKIMIILVITAMASAWAQADSFLLNGFGWGTPKDQIMADADSSPALRPESEKCATFTAQNPYGPPTTGVYLFTEDNRLGGSGYVWYPKTSPQNMLEEFNRLKADLTATYGQPYNDRGMWNSSKTMSLAAEDPVKGLELGGYCLNTAWETEDTTVTLTMMSSAFHDVPTSPVNTDTVSIKLLYFSKDLRHVLKLVPIF